MSCFFFQAEDGIRIHCVTGVQTCALPIFAQGFLFVGGWLVLFAGIFDMFDGAMARVRNASTIFGAFFDSTLDRYSESIIRIGRASCRKERRFQWSTST